MFLFDAIRRGVSAGYVHAKAGIAEKRMGKWEGLPLDEALDFIPGYQKPRRRR